MKTIAQFLEVFLVSLKLGLTSFGGPIAHVGYFHKEYVTKRKWMDESGYLELVAICQVLPGPTSSQLSIGIGTVRAGLVGGILAWFGFTLPSAVLLTFLALLSSGLDVSSNAWIHGLKLVALAVVFQAVLSMWKKLITTRALATIALFAMIIVVATNSAIIQIIVIALAGIYGTFFGRTIEPVIRTEISISYSKTTGLICLFAFVFFLISLPLLGTPIDNSLLTLADGFYRSGSLVFGGGHVVLPLLEKEFVSSNLVSKETLLFGYGAAQAVPGPLFTFAAYLGGAVSGVLGAVVGIFTIFLPGFLLIIGVLPFWSALRKKRRFMRLLETISASVVGILLAALYEPLWTTSIQRPIDLCITTVFVIFLVVWELPPCVAVLIGLLGTLSLSMFVSIRATHLPVAIWP